MTPSRVPHFLPEHTFCFVNGRDRQRKNQAIPGSVFSSYGTKIFSLNQGETQKPSTV